MNFDPRPVTLEGRHVSLEPLDFVHLDGLFHAARDKSIWRYLPSAPFFQMEDTRTWIGQALEAVENGSQVAFAIVDRASRKTIGSTRYLDISRPNRSLEIGWTWIAKEFQRTAVNTECKYLLLKHAFEDLGALRVQLKTDRRNRRSQKAIARIGGVREGVLRKHLVLWDGFVRDTVYFSILDSEWPGVKTRLERMLRKHSNSQAPMSKKKATSHPPKHEGTKSLAGRRLRRRLNQR